DSWHIDCSDMIASFEVISDQHITLTGNFSDHLTNALADIAATAPDSDAIFCNGDSVDIGNEATYDYFLSLLAPYESQLPEIYYAIGNHEYFGSDASQHYNTDLNCAEKAQLFMDKLGAPGLYYDTYINDIHFIVLGSEEALVADTSEDGYVSDDAYISDEQFEWLEEELAETEGTDTPIFVFLHQPMADTVAGTIGGKSGQGWNGLSDEQDAELREILFDYPQTIMFSGHTHWILEAANEMYDGGEDKPTIFNTASVGYLWTDVPYEDSVAGSQGLYVETYEDKVLVRGRDFDNGKWIPSASYIVDMDSKYDFIDNDDDSDDSSSDDNSSNHSHSDRTKWKTDETTTSIENNTSGNETTTGISVNGRSDSNGNVKGNITDKTATELVEGAEAAEDAGNKAVVNIEIESGLSAQSVGVNIPRSAFSELADNTDADMTLTTGIGSMTFDSAAIDDINKAANGDISIEITKVDSSVMPVETASKIGDRPIYNFSMKSGNSTISDFGGGTVTASVPYTLAEGEDPNAIVVYYISDSGELQLMNGCYNADAGAVEFTTSHFSKYAVGYNEISFSDVDSSDWYHDAVTFVAARGITTGTSSNVFGANEKLTRGQFMVMLMRAYGIEADENPMDNFDDAGNTYYTNYLAAAKRLSITDGIGDNLFAPDSEISRQDMFTLMYRTLDVIGELPVESSSKTIADFSDSGEVSSYAQQAMNAFVKADAISGCNGTLDPNGTSTRAQIVQVLYNLLSA
ncbi:MAG: S-layer homology domain-containing protein, partial [Clostridia bacterium]